MWAEVFICESLGRRRWGVDVLREDVDERGGSEGRKGGEVESGLEGDSVGSVEHGVGCTSSAERVEGTKGLAW